MLKRAPNDRSAPVALDLYLREIGRHPLFDAASERQAAQAFSAARHDWAVALLRFPSFMIGLLDEVSAHVDAGRPVGALADGLLDGRRDLDAACAELRSRHAALQALAPGAARTRAEAQLAQDLARVAWRPRGLRSLLARLDADIAEVCRIERWILQLCRYAGGLSAGRLADCAPGAVSRTWLRAQQRAGHLDAALLRGLLPQLETPWREAATAAARLGVTSAAALAGADALQRAHAEMERRRSAMITANLRLVVSVARGYAQLGVALEDLIGEGNLGLLRAVDRFDPSLGFRFSTYATWWIRQAVSRAVAEQGRTIRVPARVLEMVGRLRRATAAHLMEQGREPSEAELLAMDLGPAERVRAALDLVQQPLSLDAPLRDGSEDTLASLLDDPDGTGQADAAAADAMQTAARGLLRTLDERAAMVVRLRFGLDSGRERTLAEVGEVLGLSGERVRQIEREALEALRARADPLRSLLDD